MAPAVDIETGIPLGPLGAPSSSHPRAHPSGSATTNERRYKHDGLYSRILDDRKVDGEEQDEFYRSYEVEKVVVKGLPWIAAFHAKYANTRTCRAFHFLTQRLTTLYQCQLTCLLGALVNLDAESATGAETQGENGRQPVPFDTEKFISRCLRSPDQASLLQVPRRDDGCEEDEEQKRDRIDAMRENLVANIESIFDKYCNRVNWQYELRKFPRASTNTHEKTFKHIQDISGLDPEALDYLRADDDFIYADADPLYERFHTFLIYLRNAVARSVRTLSGGRIFADENSPPFGRGAYSARAVQLSVQILMVISSSTLVLTPVGILYLDMPSRGIAFVIVALFGILFAFTLIAFDNRMSHVLLGLAAYYAVLVVFLSISS
ncbi:hypothetical protein GGR51DRAFT_577587 [Nemania sp. FL0031]|nr:hypothetical protein GGR51DRAFT_577587 [Nemania sp. FL0031]